MHEWHTAKEVVMRSHIRNITRRAAKMNSVDGIICEAVKLVVRKAVTRIVARLIMGRVVVPRVVTKRSTGTSQKERYQKERYQKERQKIVLARLVIVIRRSVTRRMPSGGTELTVTRTVVSIRRVGGSVTLTVTRIVTRRDASWIVFRRVVATRIVFRRVVATSARIVTGGSTSTRPAKRMEETIRRIRRRWRSEWKGRGDLSQETTRIRNERTVGATWTTPTVGGHALGGCIAKLLTCVADGGLPKRSQCCLSLAFSVRTLRLLVGRTGRHMCEKNTVACRSFVRERGEF